MSYLLIDGAGGPAGVGLTRCLKPHFPGVFGRDSSQWGTAMMEADENTENKAIDLYIPIADSLVATYTREGQVVTFLPPIEQVEQCQDKAKAAEMLRGIAPKTYWMRDTVGAGGKGAQMLSEYLPGRNYSVEFVYKNGVQLAKFQKERLSYLVKSREPMVTAAGASAVSVCTDREDVFFQAEEALLRLREWNYRRAKHDSRTHVPALELNGFYGVDLREDETGTPRVNEINAGRLLTASYTYFWKTGYNLPLVGVCAALGKKLPTLPAYPVGYGIIRQADQEPRLFGPEITKDWQ